MDHTITRFEETHNRSVYVECSCGWYTEVLEYAQADQAFDDHSRQVTDEGDQDA